MNSSEDEDTEPSPEELAQMQEEAATYLERIPLISEAETDAEHASGRKPRKLRGGSSPSYLPHIEQPYSLTEPSEAYVGFHDADDYIAIFNAFDQVAYLCRQIVGGIGTEAFPNWKARRRVTYSDGSRSMVFYRPVNSSAAQTSGIRLAFYYDKPSDTITADYYWVGINKNLGLSDPAYLQRRLHFKEGAEYYYSERYTWMFNSEESIERTVSTCYCVDLSKLRTPTIVAYETDCWKQNGDTITSLLHRIRYVQLLKDYVLFYWFTPDDCIGREEVCDSLWLLDLDDGKPILHYDKNARGPVAGSKVLSINLYKCNGWSSFTIPSNQVGTWASTWEIKLADETVLTDENTQHYRFSVCPEMYRGTFSGYPIVWGGSLEEAKYTMSKNGLTLKKAYDFQPALDLADGKLEGAMFNGTNFSKFTGNQVDTQVASKVLALPANAVAAFIRSSIPPTK
ncbi:MAG: hypothetical protein IJS52_03110 [Bacilli bacterium]|nr:hypothetical protein [Bacilli bacterium]